MQAFILRRLTIVFGNLHDLFLAFFLVGNFYDKTFIAVVYLLFSVRILAKRLLNDKCDIFACVVAVEESGVSVAVEVSPPQGVASSGVGVGTLPHQGHCILRVAGCAGGNRGASLRVSV